MNIQRFTSRNTKSEILKGYNELAKAYRDLQSKSAKSRPTPQPAARPSAPPAPGGALDAAGVIAQLETLSERIGESAGSLQQKLTAEATNLEELLEQSQSTIERLKSLHEIDFTEASLDAIIESFQQEQRKHDDELNAKREAFTKDMAERREAWRKEQDEHARQVKERIIELKKARTRDNQEYKYDLERRRATEDDAVAQAQKAFEHELAGSREAKADEWAAREKELAARETEFAELKAKDEDFPKKLESAIKQAESTGMNIARRKTKVDADLAAKEAEGRERVYKLRVKSLEEALNKQNAQLNSLSAQLESTSKRAEDLTVRAIEGASNASSFKAIQDIAMEQAKYTGKK